MPLFNFRDFCEGNLFVITCRLQWLFAYFLEIFCESFSENQLMGDCHNLTQNIPTSQRERTHDLPDTGWNALPLRYGRLPVSNVYTQGLAKYCNTGKKTSMEFRPPTPTPLYNGEVTNLLAR